LITLPAPSAKGLIWPPRRVAPGRWEIFDFKPTHHLDLTSLLGEGIQDPIAKPDLLFDRERWVTEDTLM
jgi:hypothetical protein